MVDGFFIRGVAGDVRVGGHAGLRGQARRGDDGSVERCRWVALIQGARWGMVGKESARFHLPHTRHRRCAAHDEQRCIQDVELIPRTL